MCPIIKCYRKLTDGNVFKIRPGALRLLKVRVRKKRNPLGDDNLCGCKPRHLTVTKHWCRRVTTVKQKNIDLRFVKPFSDERYINFMRRRFFTRTILLQVIRLSVW